jgi:Flp pilus assembly protein CpaB
VSRRARAAAFGCAALACAGLAAAVAGGYRADVESQLGPLRSAVIARLRVPARRPLGPVQVRNRLEVRRIPERFAPADALTAPALAVGRVPAAPIPAGDYVLAGQLRNPGEGPGRHGRAPRLGAGRKPVEISVSGAEALAATGGDPAGTRVDVIVTTEPGPGGGEGRTYVAAEDLRLLALAQSADGGSGDLSGFASSGEVTATLAVTKSQALRLIEAENFARQVRLIPH